LGFTSSFVPISPVPTGIFIERLSKPSEARKVVVEALTTSFQGAGLATTTHQGSATPTREKDPKHDLTAALAERAIPPWAEELLQYLKFQALPDDDV
jgi:hypothetical protein